jgi:hypothetical protein
MAWLAACRPVSVVDRQEEKWRSQHIADYRIRVLAVNSIWHAETHTVTVRAGVIADHGAACIPAPIENGKCAARAYDPQDFTVEGLFARARAELRVDGGRHTRVEYDPACGFPLVIAYDHPDIVDEDRITRVTAFEAAASSPCRAATAARARPPGATIGRQEE